MAQQNIHQPSKIYRGTVDEVFSHRNEIAAGAFLELRVFEGRPNSEEEVGAFGGKSLLDMFPHLFGTEHGGPDDMSEHPEKYMQG
ncbi:MAG: hypothetical protein JWL77_3598 [Chthonomonadaceae bacterium]|nr:hypothetical protein [Chthonomonadaceae bacterium]